MVWVEVYGGQGSLALYVLYITDLKRGTQRPNVSKYVRIVSNGFLYALEASLVTVKTVYLIRCLTGTLTVSKV